MLQDLSSPVFLYAARLKRHGVPTDVLRRLIDVLIALGVDVSDPHAASTELSVIVGYLSNHLLGVDLSPLRSEVVAVMESSLIGGTVSYGSR
jgi:hypothetical protein